MGTVAARYKENGKLSDVVPDLDESRHRLAAVAGTSTCHLVQVSTHTSSHRAPMLMKLLRVLKVYSFLECGALTRCVGHLIEQSIIDLIQDRTRYSLDGG